MTQANVITLALLAGAAGFVYLYYWFPQRFEASEREQVSDLRWYTWVDRYLKAASLAVPLLALHTRPAWLLLVHDNAAARWAGLAVAAAGWALFVWAIRTLSDQYAPCNAARLPSRLVDQGPYRWVRHPIYTANLVMLAGLAVLSGSPWMVANLVLLAACYAWITRREEATLRQHVPGYADYATRRGRFFPKF